MCRKRISPATGRVKSQWMSVPAPKLQKGKEGWEGEGQEPRGRKNEERKRERRKESEKAGEKEGLGTKGRR